MTPINRTLQYLAMSIQTLPQVKDCLEVIMNSKQNHYFGIYINDGNYIATDESDQYLFIKVSQAAYDHIVSKAEEEIEDYYRDVDKHMIVVVKPKILNEKWKLSFVKGEYSKIYTESELKKFKLNNETDLGKIRNMILFKKEEYWDDFKKVLDKEFGGIRMDEKYDGRELDLPPKLKEEIINYKIM